MARNRRPAPVLITDAGRDPEQEFRHREIRYLAMMSVRVLCLIAAAVLISVKPPLWGLWLGLAIAGTVALPWLAVLLANDRMARSRDERAAAKRAPGTGQAALPAPPSDRVIDAD